MLLVSGAMDDHGVPRTVNPADAASEPEAPVPLPRWSKSSRADDDDDDDGAGG